MYNADLRKHYTLRSDDWKYDVMPELLDGHNVLDFVDPDIDARLAELEREEEELEVSGRGGTPAREGSTSQIVCAHTGRGFIPLPLKAAPKAPPRYLPPTCCTTSQHGAEQHSSLLPPPSLQAQHNIPLFSHPPPCRPSTTWLWRRTWRRTTGS